MKNTLSSLGFNAVMSASAFALTMGMAATASAQSTTSNITGFVTSETGAPIANAQVSLENTSTGFSRSISTDNNGAFVIRNLSVSGTYNVSISADGFQGERVEDISLTLGETSALNFALEGGSELDEVIVVAQRNVLADIAIGPSASFGLETLQNAPAINRNIADVIRLDPRVYIDESRGDINSVQCVGQSSRFNSITLDGVAINDSFGLNSNGYPTERMPFPFDALDQVSVEIAPFDVQYGGFTACNINSVTKSGTNELHGGAFIDYTDDGLRSSKVDGEDTATDFGNYDEIRYGFNLGGPIIKDRLFIFGAYEKLEGANVFNRGALGTGNFQVSQAELDDIIGIANNVYQYDPGNVPSNFANSDEKILVKVDLNITDRHRAAFTYDYNDGNNTVRSDGDSDELEFSNHFYQRRSVLESYVGSFYSDWTDNFSTELRVGYLTLDNDQTPVGGTDFGEFQIRTPRGATVYLGADDSRQANDLNYDVLDFIFRANYDMGNHQFSGGYERKDLDIFNLFIQQAQTETRFTSIENFRNGIAEQVEFNNAPSLNQDDAAASFGYAINTVYGQDEFSLGDLTLVAGLRYDWYTSDDLPTENPDFVADYGFSNSQNLDGKGLLQPRLGFTFDATDELQFRGGVGKYSGGNPNVWISNNYSGNNVDQVGARIRDRDVGIDLFSLNYTLAEDGVPNAPGYAVPQQLADQVATGEGSNFELNYLDPDFEIPSEWKYSFGATWSPDFNTGEPIFGGRWTFQGDLLYSDAKNTAIIQHGDLEQTGTTVFDGVTYPTYDSVRLASYVLTNSDVSNEAFVASLGASKEWDNGIALTLGYAYSDAKDVQPMTSSVANSNYQNRAFVDPEEQVLSTSNYNIKHRFTGSLSYTKDFWDNYDTRFFAFFQSSSGRPYSRVQDVASSDIYGFTPFLNDGVILVPGTERNEFSGPSWTKVDLKISQDLPGFRSEDRAQVFMVIDNLTNLLNDEWGVLEEPSFPRLLRPGQDFSTSVDASAYEIRFGASYDF